MSYGLGVLFLGGSLAVYALFLLRVAAGEFDRAASADTRATYGVLVASWVSLGALGVGASALVPTATVLGIALLLVVLVLLVPWPIATSVMVPLGWPRAAYAMARLSTARARRDPVGLAMLVAARAVARQRRPRREARSWVADRRRQRPLTPGMVMAHGLLATSRGEPEEARRLLDTLQWFDARVTDPTVDRLAREWQVADAAQRGAWSEVDARAHALGPSTPATDWLGGVARRLLGSDDAPDDDHLERLWRRVPHRGATRWLQERALRARPAVVPTVELPDDPLGAALEADRLLAHHPSPEAVELAASTWSPALPALEAVVRARATTLGSHRPERAAEEARGLVRERLVEGARRAGVAAPPLAGASGDDPRREALLSAIELAASALGQRLDEGRSLPADAELREWVGLAGLLAEAEAHGGVPLLRLAFRAAYGPLCSQSVRLYNVDRQPWLSNAITRWLLDLAERVGDARAVALQTKNLAAVASL